jgi:hypothetical protein
MLIRRHLVRRSRRSPRLPIRNAKPLREMRERRPPNRRALRREAYRRRAKQNPEQQSLGGRRLPLN